MAAFAVHDHGRVLWKIPQDVRFELVLVELNRRAGHRSIAAEDATVAGLRLESSAAADAIVEEEAGIRWHGLFVAVATRRACDHR